MTRRVLDVGQCAPDHAAIRRLLENRFSAEVVQTQARDETLARLRESRYDLVLINRKLDLDYSDGLEILKAIKQDPELAGVPVMLVTNYPEHQQAAVAAGAEPGFGKSLLEEPETIDKLNRFLA